MKSISIIVKAGTVSGFGHIIRQFSLYKLIKIKCNVHLYILLDTLDQDISQFKIKFNNYSVFKNETKLLDDIPFSTIVFFDAYDFNIDLLNAYVIKNKWKIVVCSDINRSIPDCDLLINHLPNVDINSYYPVKIRKYLLGPKYSILRKTFYNKILNKSQNRIFICLGGSNVQNEINLIYNALLKNGFSKKNIDIVSSEKINDPEFTNYYFNISEKKIQQLISHSNICFITPGNISYEVFSINRNVVLGSLNESQVIVAELFDELKLAINVGIWKSANFSHLLNWIKESSRTNIYQKEVFNNFEKESIRVSVNQLLFD